MTEREKVMKRSFFSTIGSIFWIILLFVLTYGVIRLLPKPS
jgi:capsule polysaccharide export protein KpsE/RkpR